mmetsp:Transcript_1656/g.4522  ORF Transcript_1656/g.4522 Transcript_1656/m.4522 type:complete len:286 (-) Transcript_1656:693-1550(-)
MSQRSVPKAPEKRVCHELQHMFGPVPTFFQRFPPTLQPSLWHTYRPPANLSPCSHSSLAFSALSLASCFADSAASWFLLATSISELARLSFVEYSDLMTDNLLDAWAASLDCVVALAAASAAFCCNLAAVSSFARAAAVALSTLSECSASSSSATLCICSASSAATLAACALMSEVCSTSAAACAAFCASTFASAASSSSASSASALFSDASSAAAAATCSFSSAACCFAATAAASCFSAASAAAAWLSSLAACISMAWWLWFTCAATVEFRCATSRSMAAACAV